MISSKKRFFVMVSFFVLLSICGIVFGLQTESNVRHAYAGGEKYTDSVTVSVNDLGYGMTKAGLSPTVTAGDDLKVKAYDILTINGMKYSPISSITTEGNYVVMIVLEGDTVAYYFANSGDACENTVTLSCQATPTQTITSGAEIYNVGKGMYAEADTPSENVYLVLMYMFTLTNQTLTYDKNTVDTVKNMPTDEEDAYLPNQAVTPSSATPTRANYIFEGWATESDGEVITTATVPMGVNGLTLFAKWRDASEDTRSRDVHIDCPDCVNGWSNCISCGGTGKETCSYCSSNPGFCPECGGTGLGAGMVPCPDCGGEFPECGTCGGSGEVPESCPDCCGNKICKMCNGTKLAECVTCSGQGYDTCNPEPCTTCSQIGYSIGVGKLVTLDANGVTPNEAIVQPNAIETGKNFSAFPILTADRFLFKGWSTDSKAATASYTDESSYTVNADVTFYAVWEGNGDRYNYTQGDYDYEPYYVGGDTVKFIAGPSSDDTKCIYVNGVEVARISECEEYSYTILHDGAVLYGEDTCYIVDISCYPVLYDSNGGTGTAPTETAPKGVGYEITLPSGTGLSYVGYTFEGWSTNKSATTGSTDLYTVTDDDVVEKTITFYAVWKVCSTHDWSGKNGKCKKCGKVCVHDWENSVCKTCGYSCKHGEFYRNDEKTDDESHEIICSDCGKILSDDDHTYESGVCTICFYHCKHGSSTDYQKDETQHWLNCLYCGQEEAELGDHTYENGFCTVCGYECPHATWENGFCTVCDYECSHDWSSCNGVCAICDMECSHDSYEYDNDFGQHWHVCTTCGMSQGDEENHDFSSGTCVCGMNCPHSSTSYEKDDSQHWEVCDDCGETVGNKEDHDFSSGTCVCGKDCPHDSTSYNYNDTQHWKECDECGATIGDEEDHDFSSGTCVCGMNCPHDSTSYEKDDSQHWKVCDDCGETVGNKEDHDFSTGICECGKDCPHDSTSYNYNDTQHWKECDECGATVGDEEDHDFSSGTCVCGKNCPHSSTHYESINDEEHSIVCDVCGDLNDEDHDYAEDGKDMKCTACNHVCTHSSTTSRNDETQHWEECDHCEKTLEKENHDWNEEGHCTTCEWDCDHSYVGGICEYCGVKKEYSVVFDLNGGEGDAPIDDSTYYVDDDVDLPGDSDFMNVGYRFDGWSVLASALGGDEGFYSLTADVLPEGDTLTLYAIWIECAPHDWTDGVCDYCHKKKVYTLAFDVNGGTGNAPSVSGEYSVEDSFDLPEQGEIVYIGYIYKGWSIDSSAQSGYEDSYTIDGVDCPSEEDVITFYMIWEECDAHSWDEGVCEYCGIRKECGIEYDLNGGSGTKPIAVGTYSVGDSVDLPEQGNIVRAGYLFKGWSIDSSAESGDTGSYTILGTDVPDDADDITFYVCWKELETVTITETAQTFTYGDKDIAFVVEGTTIEDFTVWYYINSDWTEDAPTAAGKYTVKVTRAEDTVYKAFSKELTEGLVIRKKDITFTVIDVATGTFTYDGTAKTTTASYTDLIGTDELTYTLAYSDNVTAGTCIVTIESASITSGEANNYNIITSDTGTLVIDKAAVLEPTVGGTYRYTGKVQTVTINGVESYMSTTDALCETHAGDYTIIYVLDDNHQWADGSDGVLTWTIEKASATVTVDTTEIIKTFGETVVLPQATADFGEVVCSETSNILVNAGTYTVVYSVAETSDYFGDSKSLNVTIRRLTVSEPIPMGTYIFNGESQTVELSNLIEGMTTTDSITQTDAGVYTITYTLDDNHEWADGSDGIVVWEIMARQKETPTASEEEKPQVTVENEKGFSSDISVTVDVVAETGIDEATENEELRVNYYELEEEGVKLSKDEKIGVVYDVKLIQTTNGVSKEIQLSDLQSGSKIKVRMLIPATVDISKVTRILSVNDKKEIKVIEFDSSKVDANGYYEVEIDKLGEFAFVYSTAIEEPCVGHWIILGFTCLVLIHLIIGACFIWFRKIGITITMDVAAVVLGGLTYLFADACPTCNVMEIILISIEAAGFLAEILVAVFRRKARR